MLLPLTTFQFNMTNTSNALKVTEAKLSMNVLTQKKLKMKKRNTFQIPT